MWLLRGFRGGLEKNSLDSLSLAIFSGPLINYAIIRPLTRPICIVKFKLSCKFPLKPLLTQEWYCTMRSHRRRSGDAEWQAYRPVDIDARPVKCQLSTRSSFKSNISYCLQLCSSDNRSAENTACQYCHSVAIALLCKMPAAVVNALSASTDDGGILNKYLYIPILDRGLVCHLTRTSQFHPRWLPVGISPLLWGVGNHRPGQWCVNSEFHIRCLRVRSLDCFLYSVSLSSAGDI